MPIARAGFVIHTQHRHALGGEPLVHRVLGRVDCAVVESSVGLALTSSVGVHDSRGAVGRAVAGQEQLGVQGRVSVRRPKTNRLRAGHETTGQCGLGCNLLGLASLQHKDCRRFRVSRPQVRKSVSNCNQPIASIGHPANHKIIGTIDHNFHSTSVQVDPLDTKGVNILAIANQIHSGAADEMLRVFALAWSELFDSAGRRVQKDGVCPAALGLCAENQPILSHPRQPPISKAKSLHTELGV
mmetsp:Transcript_58864/g.157349  ORF Transcript_58864/g.157349 Transcript_58864/m.157349 type:complete len:242 (-) Transcript_58864:623-1348(-)